MVVLVKFGTQLLASRERRKYLLVDWHWVGAVALIPATHLRWLRFVRLVRALGGVFRGLAVIEKASSSRTSTRPK